LILLDALDFRLLRALAQCAIEMEQEPTDGEPDVKTLHAYLADEIRRALKWKRR